MVNQQEQNMTDSETEQAPIKFRTELPSGKKIQEGDPGSKTGKPLRLYADGVFDLFHFGHAKALQQCKESFANVHLIVGCCSDEMTHKLKGRTVMTDQERYESLRHCRWVDEVVEDAPWVVTDEFMEQHQIDYVCHDALPYGDTSGEASDGDVYARLKSMGKFLETQRTDGISTSDLIIRIVKEYDTFIQRNLQRGHTRKEMNVPFVKDKTIKMHMAMDRMRSKASSMHTNFADMFGKDGRFRNRNKKGSDSDEDKSPVNHERRWSGSMVDESEPSGTTNTSA